MTRYQAPPVDYSRSFVSTAFGLANMFWAVLGVMFVGALVASLFIAWPWLGLVALFVWAWTRYTKAVRYSRA